MKLGDIVTVKIGRNLSRRNEESEKTLIAYSYEDLMNDLSGALCHSPKPSYNEDFPYKDQYISLEGDILFSFVSSKAGIVSHSTEGKIINQNFAKLVITYDQLDSSYLCYALNEAHFVKKQMAISMQGSTVPRLTPSILKELEIDLPGLEKQKVIGKAYFTFKKRQELAKKQAELEEQLFLEMLKQISEK